MKNMKFKNTFLAFTFFYAVGIYVLLIGFFYWMEALNKD